jgi:hypothetical protein
MMAVFSEIQWFEWRAALARASYAHAASVLRCRSLGMQTIASRVWVVAAETMGIAWMLLALAFWLSLAVLLL